MRDFWRTATRPRSMRLAARVQEIVDSFSASGRLLFYFFAGLLIISSVGLVYLLDEHFLISVPAQGGTLVEGDIGAPRFINPILAISDADQDLTALVYSGLLKATPAGTYVPDLAASYNVSPDGLTYTFTLKPDATFQDGSPVTADDVIFTVEKAQDPTLKSPQQANWSGVTVTEIDAHTVEFTLKQAYAPFIDNLTLGILPKHLWGNISDDEFPFSDLNTSPIGSGPFKVASIARTSSGIPSSYSLAAFNNYTLGRAYLNGIDFHFYQNEDDLLAALKGGTVRAASGLSPSSLAQLGGLAVDRASLNRVFAVFFNQNQSQVLRDANVRQALSDAVNRSELVSQVLFGYGTPLEGPVPPGILPAADTAVASAGQSSQGSATTTDPALVARAELIDAGWKVGSDGILQKTTGSGKSATTQELEFSLATGDVPELQAAADYLKSTWERMGAKVNVQVYEQGDLSQNVIRPRKFDALLFGEVVGRELDLFAFWDSSQRNDPGLNIAGYANSIADKLLEQLRQTGDEGQRASLYEQFDQQLQKDNPAVFLYAPDFVYIVPKDIHGVDLGLIEAPSDRFLSVTDWYLQTDDVWPLFVSSKK